MDKWYRVKYNTDNFRFSRKRDARGWLAGNGYKFVAIRSASLGCPTAVGRTVEYADREGRKAFLYHN